MSSIYPFTILPKLTNCDTIVVIERITIRYIFCIAEDRIAVDQGQCTRQVNDPNTSAYRPINLGQASMPLAKDVYAWSLCYPECG